jgi:HNH endonuclease
VESPSRRTAFQAVLHVPMDASPGHLHNGPALPEALSRQLLCDASGTVIGLRGGRPIDVGRRCHIVPLALRRVVELRDRGCRVPGCTGSRVQIHHIVHWKDGGPTASHNLAALCPRHHRLHHRGLLGITGNADVAGGLTFTDARGRPLAGAPPPRPPLPGARVEVTGTWTHPAGERLESRWVHFNQRRAAAEPRAG